MTYEALGFDPAPGDPGRGQQMVTRLRQATNALGEMERVLGGSGDDHWDGKTATAFYGLVDEDLRPRVTEAHQSFDEATRALDRWLVDLDDYQGKARALEIEAQEARDAVHGARSLLDGLDAPVAGADTADRDDFERRKGERERSLAAHRGALDDVLRRARGLADDAEYSASTTARALKTAMDVAPDEPGLWDKLGNALEGIGEFLGDAIEFVKDNWWDLLHRLVNICATILAVASLFFPALAPFALAFALADVAMSGIDWARGVPGAKEAFLTGAIGLAGGFAVGKLVGPLVSGMEASLASGPFRVLASGGAASVAAPAAAVISVNPTFGPALAGYVVFKAKDAKDGGDAIVDMLGGNTYYSGRLADGWRRARDD